MTTHRTPAGDLDDTARLVLMDNPDCTPAALWRHLQANGHPDVGLDQLGRLWEKYHGYTVLGTRPTHDVTTGHPIPGRT